MYLKPFPFILSMWQGENRNSHFATTSLLLCRAVWAPGGPFHAEFPVNGETSYQRDANTGGPLCSNKVTACVNIQLTLLYGLGDFGCILGEVQVCHVGLQVANRALSSRHAESLYAQIWEDAQQQGTGDVQVN